MLGIYYYSMFVVNFVEMVVEYVGVNFVIVRIGFYYYDIGKIERLYYFGEN